MGGRHSHPVPLIGVLPMVRTVVAALRRQPYIKAVEPCGPLRRGLPSASVVDIVVSGPLQDAVDTVLSLSRRYTIRLTAMDRKLKRFAVSVDGFYLNFQVTTEEHFGAWVLFLTGSTLFNMIVRSKAKKMGYKLRDDGLYHNGILIAGRDERQILDALGLEWVEPTERNLQKKQGKSAYHPVREKKH